MSQKANLSYSPKFWWYADLRYSPLYFLDHNNAKTQQNNRPSHSKYEYDESLLRKVNEGSIMFLKITRAYAKYDQKSSYWNPNYVDPKEHSNLFSNLLMVQ